jgi:hypothetical protein
MDSPLEGDGFEPSNPREIGLDFDCGGGSVFSGMTAGYFPEPGTATGWRQ